MIKIMTGKYNVIILIVVIFFTINSCAEKSKKNDAAEQTMVIADLNINEEKKIVNPQQTFEETQDSLRKRLIKSKPNENLKLSILQELYIRGLVNQVNDKIIFNLPFDLHGLDCGAPDCYSTDISFEISSNDSVQFPKTINFNLFEHGCIDQEISTKGVFNLVEESSEYINYFSKKLKSNLIIKKDGQVYYYPHGKTNTISVKTLNKMFENYEFEKENVIVPYRLTIMEKNEYQSFIEI